MMTPTDYKAEIEHLRAVIRATSEQMTKLAFSIPAPNEWTPQFVMLAQAAERELHK
jgi:hypothetical protein